MNMYLTKLSKTKLLSKCNEQGITKCETKTKDELINMLQEKLSISISTSLTNNLVNK